MQLKVIQEDEFCSFEKGKVFKLDKPLHFGRYSKNLNDPFLVPFSEKATKISRKQFQIENREIICKSSSNPTFFKVHNDEIALKTKSIFNLSGQEFFTVENIFFGEYSINFTYETFKTQKSEMKECLNALVIEKNDSNDQTMVENKNHYEIGNNETTLQKEKPELKAFISLLCLNGEHKKAGLLKLEVPNPNQDRHIFKLGRDFNCEIKFEGKHVSRYQSQIIYKKGIGFFLTEKAVPDQIRSSENGTYFMLKNYDEYVDKKESLSYKLTEGMIIALDGNELLVEKSDITE